MRAQRLFSVEPDAPVLLALLRIAVAALVVTSDEVWSTMALDATTTALRTPPEGLGWFSAHVPVTAALVNLSRVLVAVTGISSLVGFRTRASLTALSVASFYLFGCSEMVGAARHDMHLLWFTVLLAVSPCASFWSVDVSRGHAPAEPRNATIALWMARALLAIVYFFPGYWKLREAGLHWAVSDNLRNQMYWKWFQNAWLPPIRIDRYPSLVRAGAGGVMLLELGFPLLVLFRRGRLLAAASGLGFHLFANLFMRLGFSSLWWCYAPLLDGRWLVAWLYDTHADEPLLQGTNKPRSMTGPATNALPLVLIGALLVGADVVQGFRGAVQAWPFACYPTFQYEAGSEMPDLVVTAASPDGREQTLYTGTRGVSFRDPREWGIVWRLLGAYGGAVRVDGLSACYRRLEGRGQALHVPDRARSLRFYRGDFSVLPENRGHGPVRATFVGEMALPAATGVSVPER